MIIISLVLGIFVRVFAIFQNYYFTGELGKELLFVRNLIMEGRLPLVGLTTSHEWLTYGPLYYWILIPLVRIFGPGPYILFWLALATSVIGTIIAYFVFEKVVNKRFAIILTFFISLSPVWIWATRLSKLHTFFFILIPIVIYFLNGLWLRKNKTVFWLGLTYGLLFSFHYSQIPLFAVILAVFWIRRKSINLKDYLKFILGLVLANITVLIYDAKNGFSMTKNLLLWIPYRIVGFLHLYPKNNIDAVIAGSTLSAFNEFLGRNLFWDNRFWILGSLIYILLFVSFFIQNRKRLFKDFISFYIIFSTLAQLTALLIHTSPPLHYFMPIYINFGLMFAYFTVKYWKKICVRILTVVIFALMFTMAILNTRNEHVSDIDYVPLEKQINAVNYIIKDAKGVEFNLRRIGPFDYFPDQYKQNYELLILNAGGKMNPKAPTTYTIYDMGGKISVIKNE